LKTELETKLINKFNEGIGKYHEAYIAPIKKDINENSQKLQRVDVELKRPITMLEEKDKKIQELLDKIVVIGTLKNHLNSPQSLKNQSSTSVSAKTLVASHNFYKETFETFKFNKWAMHPRLNLDTLYFSYILGNFHLRTVQKLTLTKEATAWIVNKIGPCMLLPNPNFLDPMWNITELYKMDQNRLKPKGQNSFRIIRPCLMADTGFIEFPGELELL
jgi:hypothetical protein